MSSFRLGLYRWSYQGGDFNVAFRPQGIFFCQKFPADAEWRVTPDSSTLQVDWKKFGVYEFPIASGGDSYEGSAARSPENWRKIDFIREFTYAEKVLLGDGFGTAWNFQYEKGSFDIEFRCDGYNHFNCPRFPAHSHWSMDEGTGLIAINWGQYGEYEMTVEEGTTSMTGCKKGQPSNWRRATLLRALGSEALVGSAHDHAHEHVHGENCKH